ncbi:unnamed protein product [Adineta steineri]|uniref:NAD(P)(+)--arginine ADP-ribosyltransferase n=1 Tax=Adineta steineri TaxID=433720 RepID=A0A814G7P9_9BILA|nr:unnamed protein product [Adineta steineri]CAF3965560.1 unnamed protein product [Adineta steineri]
MDLPVALDRSFGGQYGWISPFIVEVRRYLGLQPDELPSKKPNMISDLVEIAAQGIIEEGTHIRKQREAEKLANILREKKSKGVEEVWQCCAYLYSLESFLYKTLNANMRLVGSKEENTWRHTVRTLGPFCLLLWDDPYNKKMKTNIELYRGANLKPEHIAAYKKMAKNKEEYGSFQGFSSCSRNRGKAEAFGNTLFIIRVLFAFIADISKLSEYPNEEEELVTPGVCFCVLRVEEEPKTGKHVIYLELRQRFSSDDHQKISTQNTSYTEKDAYDRLRARGNGDARFDFDAAAHDYGGTNDDDGLLGRLGADAAYAAASFRLGRFGLRGALRDDRFDRDGNHIKEK